MLGRLARGGSKMDLEQWGFLTYVAGWACSGAVAGVLEGWDKGRPAEESFRWTFLMVTGLCLLALVFDGIWPWPGAGLEEYLVVIFAGFASALGAFGGCKVARHNKNQACMLSGILAGTIAPAIFYLCS